VARWAGRIAESARVRVRADGDRIRVPAAWCAMAGCEAAFADPAALGEADNRARAVAAGWARDALGRLVCPACQRAHPVPAWWVLCPEAGTVGDRGPVGGTARPTGGTNQSVRSAAAGRPPAAAQGGHHRTQWPRLLSALVSSRDGWTTRAGPRIPAAGTMPGQARTATPHTGQAVHAAGSAGRRAPAHRTAATTGGWTALGLAAGHRLQRAVAPRLVGAAQRTS
jgi:hypothetical protein